MASMESFPDILEKAFYPERAKAPEKPKEAPKVAPKPKAARGVFDMALIAEAQRVFNPAQAQAPTKGPTATTAAIGSTPAMGTGGAWGKPE